ncbi:hypothetical protein EV177_009265 [Coemansia sp. RSA 1804]|nr:hypothetical protein EV177_009265 [Coemansia sp. RSA 1804]
MNLPTKLPTPPPTDLQTPPELAQNGGTSLPSQPAGGDGRGALLASIRGAGGIGSLRKVDRSTPDRASVSSSLNPKSPSGETSPGPKADGNLANALASALAQRKNAIRGDSDSDTDDEW